MISDKIIDEVKGVFKLNTYEARAWLALLKKGSATAGEIAEVTGIPRSRIYDVLESLARKGFIFLRPSKPTKYIAFPPDHVIEVLKQNIKMEYEEKIKELESLRESQLLEKLREIYSGSSSSSVDAAMVSGYKRILPTIAALINSAKEKVVLLAPREVSEKNEGIKKLLEDAKKRGLLVKVMNVGNTSEYGKVLIVDDHVLLFPEEGHKMENAILLKSKALAEAISRSVGVQ